MTPRGAFWRGYRDCAPFILIVVPYSMLFGVVARDAGLDIVQTMAMAVLVIAGASQYTALALLQDHAPVFVALLAALAVNLRMAMYSAALQPHLGHAPLGMRALMAYLMVDQAFAVAVRTYEDQPQMPQRVKVAYYMGCMLLICPFWYGGTLAGAVLGQAIPASLFHRADRAPVTGHARDGGGLRFGLGRGGLRRDALGAGADRCGAAGGAGGRADRAVPGTAEGAGMIEPGPFWMLTVLLGIGTFLIRFSFLGLLGGRSLPASFRLYLRYVGVAVFPALFTPLLLWPAATGGETDPIRLIAAAAAFVAGLRISVIGAIVAGMGTLYALQFITTLFTG